MDEDFLKGSYKDRRSGRDRRSELRFERSDEAKFLLGKAQFVHPSELAIAVPKAAGDGVANHDTWTESTDRRSGERRSGRNRRCGFDSRSEIGRFRRENVGPG